MLNSLLKPLSRLPDHLLFSSLREALREEIRAADLDGFRASQALAYDCAQTIAGLLQPGWTEKRTAKLMDTYLRDHGVRSYFHRSFAWFGERTRFDGIKHSLDFLPSERSYREGEVVILDTAPILNGYPSDIGFSFCLGENPAFDRALEDLKAYRQLIPQLFARPGVKGSEIYSQMNARLSMDGYDNRHQRYPLGALGHRLYKMPLDFIPGLLIPFSWQSLAGLLSQGLFSEVLGPYHQGQLDGLWAVEPHLGAEGFGVKFEEMLWVQGEQVKWIDEAQFYARN